MWFQPNCTLPPPNASFVYDPQVRGTLQIVWTCLSIFLLCTWQVQHLNVPPPARPQNTKQRVWRWCARSAHRARWMLLALLAPEWLFAKAVGDRWAAYYGDHNMRKLAERDGVEWSRTHAFLANMGGFMIQFEDDTRRDDDDPRKSQKHSGRASQDAESASMQNPGDQHTVHHHDTRDTTIRSQRAPNDETQVPMTGESEPQSPTAVDMQNRPSHSPAEDDLEAGPDHPDQLKGLDHLGRTLQRIVDRFDTRVFGGPRNLTSSLASGIASGLNDVLLDWSKHPAFGLDAFATKIKAMDSRQGPSGWCVNPHNHDAILSLFRSARINQVARQSVNDAAEWYHAVAALQGSVWALDGNQLRCAREYGIVAGLPDMSKDQIANESQSDGLVKTIACAQIAWLAIQMATRTARHQPVTQLETLALAFAVCTLATYLVIWEKPQDVLEPRYIRAERYPTPGELSLLGYFGRRSIISTDTKQWVPDIEIVPIVTAWNLKLLPASELALAVGSLVFGAVHCVAWNAVFPTPIEQLLWRASSIITATAPGFVFLTEIAFWLDEEHHWKIQWVWRLLQGPLYPVAWIALVLYFAARLFTMVEALRSLAYLPPDVYATTEVVNVPHWG